MANFNFSNKLLRLKQPEKPALAGGEVEQGERFRRQLQSALANLLVSIIGSTDRSHFVPFLFSPVELHSTFPVAFAYGQMPGPEGLSKKIRKAPDTFNFLRHVMSH